jgi:hypothetical protein
LIVSSDFAIRGGLCITRIGGFTSRSNKLRSIWIAGDGESVGLGEGAIVGDEVAVGIAAFVCVDAAWTGGNLVSSVEVFPGVGDNWDDGRLVDGI